MSAVAPKPRVVLGSHEPALRAGMRLALRDVAELTEVDGPAAAVDAVGREASDVCFLDADHGGSGIRATELIRRSRPDAQVVLVAHTPTEEEFLQAVRAGAAGYLPETVDPSRLPNIVEGVLRGEAAVPRTFVRRLFDEVRHVGKRSVLARDRREVTLTRREAQVLDLMRAGLPTHAVAHRLGIADVTVRRHRSSLFSKLDVSSRAELLAIADSGGGVAVEQ